MQSCIKTAGIKMDRRFLLKSMVWKTLEVSGTQGISFAVSIILARLLLPNDFGVIAIVTIFTTIATVFVQSGLNVSLIQKPDVDEVDFSTVFYISLTMAFILYGAIFFAAPLISRFYDNRLITGVLRIMALNLFSGAFVTVQMAALTRKLEFRKLFILNLMALLVSGPVGIVLAYKGAGVWALVFQNMVNQVILVVLMFFFARWRPVLRFSFKKAVIHLKFGWKLLLSALLNTVYENIRSLIVGRNYSTEMLGYYNRGKQSPFMVNTVIASPLPSVMFPVFARVQDERERLLDMFRKTVILSSVVVFPIMIGLAVMAEPIIRIVLTDKWLPAVPYFRIFCISYVLMPIHMNSLQAVNAMGRSDLFLKLEVVKKIVGAVLLAVSIPLGIMAMALSMLPGSLIGSYINVQPLKKLLGYRYRDLIRDIIPVLMISTASGAIIFLVSLFRLSAFPGLLLQTAAGIVSYSIMLFLFQRKHFLYIMGIFSGQGK